MNLNYHNRRFRVLTNSDNGELEAGMEFLYQQRGQVVTCSYQGGSILRGQLMARVMPDGELDMRYHQLTLEGEWQTGICRSRPELLPDGRLRLHERWQWTSGDLSRGTSVLEEVGA